MLGGLSGNDALTAYVATTLLEAGEKTASARALKYLKGKLGGMDDAYTRALTAYALALGNSPQKTTVHDKLIAMAVEDENGPHWGANLAIEPPMPQPGPADAKPGTGAPSCRYVKTAPLSSRPPPTPCWPSPSRATC